MHSEYDSGLTKSESKGGKQQSQNDEESSVNSFNQRSQHPRISQDFKMRILTKKKVKVPASASSQHH